MKLWQFFLLVSIGYASFMYAQDGSDMASDISMTDTTEEEASNAEMTYASETDPETTEDYETSTEQETSGEASGSSVDEVPLNQEEPEEESETTESQESVTKPQPEDAFKAPDVDLAKPVQFEDLGPVTLPEPSAAPAPVQQDDAEQEEEMVVDELPVTPPDPVDYGEGIDTIDIDSSGNWLQKRVIWEDAQDKYEEIKDLMNRVIDARMNFFTQRNSTDKTANLFFIDIGFAQGELEEIMDELLKEIEMERLVEGDLDEAERNIKATLMEKKQEIEQLRLDLKSISELDEALDTALLELMKQINLCHDYEGQAWDKFKAIGQELDEQKAKEHYLYMDALLKNIQAIYQYISGPFNQYFSSSISKINSHMDTIKSSISSLQENGVALQKKIENGDPDKTQTDQAQADVTKSQSKTGWFASIKGAVGSAVSWVRDTSYRSWTWATSWFQSTTPKPETSR